MSKNEDQIRLLIVEDDNVLLRLLEFIFEEEPDFILHLANDQESAEAALLLGHFDAVITDLQLGNQQGGIKIIEKAFALNIPSALMTANVSHQDDYYLQQGADWVIRKPFDSRDLPHIARRLASLNE